MPSVAMTTWQQPVAGTPLPGDTVHLWRFRLTDNSAARLLNTDEIQRMQRLRIPEKANAFAVARVRLRQILSRYLQLPAEEIVLSFNDNGKPYLEGYPLYFNLSHSGEWGICAVAAHCDVGVDLERVNPELSYRPLAERYFSEKENTWLLANAESRQRRSFFRLWTRKEAWLKGKGGGFSEINLELAPEHVSATSGEAEGLWVMNFPVTKGYVGAVAVAGTVERIERWNWK